MSFPFGDRSSFRDRTKGKAGEEILDDMLKNIKQRKKEFFEWRNPGMPNDDLNSAGGSRFESHLGDFAARHPELADHLQGFPVSRKFGTVPRDKPNNPKDKGTAQTNLRTEDMFDDDDMNASGGSSLSAHLGDLVARHPELADHLYDLMPKNIKNREQQNRDSKKGKWDINNTWKPNKKFEATEPPGTATIGTQTGGLESDVTLRKTVPDMQAPTGESVTNGDRGQRSQSAPPQAPGNVKQKEEGIRLIPIKTDTPSGAPQPGQIPRPSQHFHQQHPHFPPPPQHFQHPQHQFSDQSAGHHQEESRGPTVRHIPIFVEGRDEPILPKDVGPSNVTKRGGCQGKTESAPPKRGPPPEEKKEQPPQHREQAQQTQAPTPQQQAQTPPPQPAPSQRPDPLTLVANIVKEVEAIAARVNEWKGNSRSEKEYIYLDEMLTRNLLKLDNIETEGKDEVRMARKDAIKRINAAISILEAKATPEETALAVYQENDESSNSNRTNTEAEVTNRTNQGEGMEISNTPTSGMEITSEEKKEEPMEVENPQPPPSQESTAQPSAQPQK